MKDGVGIGGWHGEKYRFKMLSQALSRDKLCKQKLVRKESFMLLPQETR